MFPVSLLRAWEQVTSSLTVVANVLGSEGGSVTQ